MSIYRLGMIHEHAMVYFLNNQQSAIARTGGKHLEDNQR